MKTSEEKIDFEFNEWFYQIESFSLLCERFFEDCRMNEYSSSVLKKWLKEAYKAGYVKEKK
jgi:hypothetical protein